MSWGDFQDYIFPFLILLFFGWRFWSNKKVKAQLPSLLEQGAIIVDVRSESEFRLGSRPGSLNIPLDKLNQRSHELDKNKPIILCCASGARSGMALGILKKNGFAHVINAGAWTNTLL